MVKIKYNPEFIVNVVEEYLQSHETLKHVERKYKISRSLLRIWVLKYKYHGTNVFYCTGHRSYTKEFKTRCVEEYLRGENSAIQIVAKYNLSDQRLLRDWIKKYNSNMELEDSTIKQEVHMARAKRKTTLEERKEIVRYCIENGQDYKSTAQKYDVSYSQVYIWVRKFETKAEAGLEDRRGHHKDDDEVSELERLRRENNRLKQQLREKDMLYELLKKVEEFERM